METLLAQFKNSMPEPLWNILVLVVTVGAAVWTVIRAFVFVGPGKVGIRKRFGKPILKYPKFNDNGVRYTKEQIKEFKAHDQDCIKNFRPVEYGRPDNLHPGFNALIPFMHSVEMIDVRRNNISMGQQRIADLGTYIAYELEEITIDIRISDAYLWLMASIDAEAQVKAIVDTQLSVILTERTIEQVRRNDASISSRLIETTAQELILLGVVLEEKALKLGPVKLDVASTFRSNAQREIAEAIKRSG